MTYAQAVTAVLLDTDGTSVVAGDPLGEAFGIQFMDELSGPGSGQCALAISDAGASECTPGRFVQIKVDGTARFTFEIEGDPEYRVISEGEDFDAVILIAGRGWGAIFDKAIVYPEVGLNVPLDSPYRVFSFASPSFPNAGAWVAAYETHEYLEGVTEKQCYHHATRASDGFFYPAPIGFPWCTSPENFDVDYSTSPPTISSNANYVDTYWIAAGDAPAPIFRAVGWHFFRYDLVLAQGEKITFTVTADNFFTFFIDGVPVLGETEDSYIWSGWKEVSLDLPAGTYTLAAAVENIEHTKNITYPPCARESFAGGTGTSSPVGLLMAAFETVGDAQDDAPKTHFISSTTSWDSHYEATLWPGWTPGQIIAQMTSEATARGAISAYVGDTFSATLDSASNAWADAQDGSDEVPVFPVDVGSTVMSALDKLREEGHIEWHVQPGTLTLDAYAPGSLGASSGVSLAQGTNLRELVRGATNVYANALLVQYANGFVEVTDAAEIASFGTAIEDVYSTDASTAAEATRQGQVELARRVASGFPAIIATVEPTSAADAPYEGFNLGETVSIPAVGGGTENVKVLSISLTTDQNGFAVWVVEMNARWKSVVRQNYELLRQIGGRSGYSRGSIQ